MKIRLTPITKEFAKANSSEGLLIDTSPWEDRALVIRKYLAVEALLANCILQWLGKTNPNLDPDSAREDVLINGPLSSAPKMAITLYHLGAMEREILDDIRSLSKLRHRYAHDHGRGKLSEEPKLMAYLENTNAYKRNRAALLQLDHQGILICLFARILSDIEAGMDSSNVA